MRRKLKTVKQRVLQSGMLIIFTLTLLLVAASGLLVGTSLKTSYLDNMHTLSQSYASSVEYQFNRLFFDINTLACSAELGQNFKAMDAPSMLKYLTAEKESHVFKDLAVTDTKGVTYDGFDFSKREYIQKGLAGTPNISSPSKSTKDNIIVYYVSQKLNNGVSDGLVFGRLDAGYFNQILKDYETKSKYGGKAFIVDEKGTYVASTDLSLLENAVNPLELAKKDEAYAGMGELVELMIAGGDGSMPVTLEDGAKYVVGYSPIKSTGANWSVAVAVPMAPIQNQFIMTCMIIFIIALFVISFAYVIFSTISNKISNPIAAVVERIKLLENGDVKTSVDIMDYTSESFTLTAALSNTLEKISAYIDEISGTLNNISQSDLNLSIENEYQGDFAPIKESLNKIIDALNIEMSQIDESALQVSTGSQNVAEVAQNLARGATQQASAIEQLSSTIVDISDKVSVTAQNAGIANKSSNEASEEISVSTQRMDELLIAMRDIDNASAEISKIIKTIEDIAFQTNILALNASVEAARAGTAGKGFSVVADEVRNLAGKCASASRDTAALIENSIQFSKRGAKLADNTSESLNKAVASAKNVCDIVDEISKASQEQAVAIEQITKGIEQISDVIQANSATAEESAASSEQLNGQATMLRDMMKKFTLKKNILYGLDPSTQEVGYVIGSNNSFDIPSGKYNF